MASATLWIGGRNYDMACREGDQPHLESLAVLIDAKAAEAAKAVGGLNETRQLLLAALLLADDLVEARKGASAAPAALAPTLDRLAQRIEALAARLENGDDAA